MRRVRLHALFILLAGSPLLAGPTQAPPVEQGPTFKLAVEFVEVDVIVTDANGDFVRGLSKADFQVLDDGKPQTISDFSVVDIPVERSLRPLYAREPIEPDVQSNDRPFEGRVYVMVIDDWHTGIARTTRVKAAARQFIQQRFGANDLMAVVHTAGGAVSGQEFTNNRRLLLAAVDKTSGRLLDSPTVMQAQGFLRRPPGVSAGTDPVEGERAMQARRSLDALRDIANWFSGVRGRRKAILFFSEGIDYDIADWTNNHSTSLIIDKTRETIEAATKANVAIYGIDPRGLTDLGDDTIAVSSFAGTGGPQAVQREILNSQDSLRQLSESTGGFAAVNANDFTSAFDRVVKENSSYYVLAYYPSSGKPGAFHTIDVRVDRPGLTVTARRGYETPKTPAKNTRPRSSNKLMTADLQDALDSPIPVSGLSMRMFAAPFKGAAPNASVLVGVEMRGRDLGLSAGDSVTLSYVAIDAGGKIRSAVDRVTLTLRPETRTIVQQTGVRFLSRLDLPPGRYQLRVAARDEGTRSVGSLLYDLEVPDFTRAPFSMSGLVLTSSAGGVEPTARPDAEIQRLLTGPPVAVRAFAQNDAIALLTDVYDNRASVPHKMDITSTLTTDEGKVLFKDEAVRDSGEIQALRGGYSYTTRIPLQDVAPGLYVLTVSARSTLGHLPPAERQVQVTVTPSTPGTSFR